MPHMTNHSHDQHGIWRISLGWVWAEVVWYPNQLSDRVFFPKRLLRKNVIDDRDVWAAQTVLIIEEAPFKQWNTHYLQVIRRYAGGQPQRHLVGWRHGGSPPIADLVVTSTHRNSIHHGGGLDSRHGAGAIQCVLPRSAYTRRAFQRSCRKRHS